jgi:hypothetical protein
VPTSLVTGDLGLSPAAASYITGFDLTKAGTRWSSAQVIGDVYAADNDPPTPTALTTAVTDMQTAYTDAAGRKNPKIPRPRRGHDRRLEPRTRPLSLDLHRVDPDGHHPHG